MANKKLRQVLEIIAYIFYLLFHATQEFIRGIFRSKEEGKVLVSRILFREKLEPNISKRQDFLTSFGEWMDLEVLDDPCWHLYCVEKNRAVFILLPRSILQYSMTKFPFMYVPIYKEVLFTNTARCGSTLMGKMLDRPGNSVCFGEPHSLCNLSIAMAEKTIPEEEIQELLTATVICLRAHVLVDQVCVLKTTSREANLVPVAKEIKDLKHIFMFRKKALMSVERMFRSVEFSANIFLTLDKLSPTICRFITDVYLGGSWANKLKPKNLRFHCAIIYASPYADYLKNKDFYCHPIIWYHDLLENPAKTLSDLFSAIDIPINCVEEALGCMKEDSQKNSFLSWEKMKHIGIPPVTKEDRFSLKEYALAMGIPEDTFDF